MKYMTTIFALSVLCTFHGEVYGMEEKHGVFDSANILLFGGIACICCAIFYIFHQYIKIEKIDQG